MWNAFQRGPVHLQRQGVRRSETSCRVAILDGVFCMVIERGFDLFVSVCFFKVVDH